jgi:hypothetical protein
MKVGTAGVSRLRRTPSPTVVCLPDKQTAQDYSIVCTDPDPDAHDAQEWYGTLETRVDAIGS